MTKDEVRHELLCTYKQPLSALDFTVRKFDVDSVVPTLVNFMGAYPGLSTALFEMHGSVKHVGRRIGLGEMLIYFIYDDVVLGGSSSSVDVWIDNQPVLEIKCGTLSCGLYTHFMLGIDEVQASLNFFYQLLQLFHKNDRLGKLSLPQNFANISKRKIEHLKSVSITAYEKLEEQYFIELLNGPVGQKKYLMFDRVSRLPVFIGELKRHQLTIDRISGGLVRLNFKP